jgi:hypothetical protein
MCVSKGDKPLGVVLLLATAEHRVSQHAGNQYGVDYRYRNLTGSMLFIPIAATRWRYDCFVLLQSQRAQIPNYRHVHHTI